MNVSTRSWAHPRPGDALLAAAMRTVGSTRVRYLDQGTSADDAAGRRAARLRGRAPPATPPPGAGTGASATLRSPCRSRSRGATATVTDPGNGGQHRRQRAQQPRLDHVSDHRVPAGRTLDLRLDPRPGAGVPAHRRRPRHHRPRPPRAPTCVSAPRPPHGVRPHLPLLAARELRDSAAADDGHRDLPPEHLVLRATTAPAPRSVSLDGSKAPATGRRPPSPTSDPSAAWSSTRPRCTDLLDRFVDQRRPDPTTTGSTARHPALLVRPTGSSPLDLTRTIDQIGSTDQFALPVSCHATGPVDDRATATTVARRGHGARSATPTRTTATHRVADDAAPAPAPTAVPGQSVTSPSTSTNRTYIDVDLTLAGQGARAPSTATSSSFGGVGAATASRHRVRSCDLGNGKYRYLLTGTFRPGAGDGHLRPRQLRATPRPAPPAGADGDARAFNVTGTTADARHARCPRPPRRRSRSSASTARTVGRDWINGPPLPRDAVPRHRAASPSTRHDQRRRDRAARRRRQPGRPRRPGPGRHHATSTATASRGRSPPAPTRSRSSPAASATRRHRQPGRDRDLHGRRAHQRRSPTRPAARR